ncbi:putative toxin biosynthesis cytochrome P450 monooxygenase [Macrophomina phaseolina]|uniref:Toxin biosynthesis cytochrome P450 monooxygenase n=1 Tax=Macrophomina phaseolina TaxID=35725 RepID=A0ABQ8G8V0_9PEZI|nr:putative toxin biosynthesis cytochrome P450 monooxygenase [Macrophomina phaseolina]
MTRLAYAKQAVCWLVGSAIYNAFVHPLRHYPGPRLNAISRIPYTVSLLQGRNPQYIKSLHDAYGPVVRINPNELSYIDGQAWRDIYALRPHGKESFEKDPVFEGPDFVGENGVARAKGDANHGRVRKTFSHAFSDRALKEQESIFQSYVNQMIGVIRRRFSAGTDVVTVGISDLYNFCTFDIMADLAFGEPLGMLTNDRYNEWVEAVFDNFKLAVFGQVLRAYPLLDALFQSFLPASLQEQRRKQQLFTTERVDKRLARQTDRPDIWTYVTRKDDGSRLTLPEMYSSASTFMLAGTETTATLLSGLTFLLLKNKRVFAKLLAEIRATIKSDVDITMQNLIHLRYLGACIEEALRFYPPVPCPLPRVVPAQGAAICGKWVPGGMVVSVCNYAANHSAANFALPDDFIPERWLDDDDDENRARFSADKRAAFQPFSYGPRGCLGKALAYHEMRLMLVKLLTHVEIEGLAADSERWMDQRIFALWEKPTLNIRVRQRALPSPPTAAVAPVAAQ